MSQDSGIDDANNKLLEAFVKMDTNHDNEIDFDEFKVGMSKIMGLDDEAMLKQLFATLDDDNSGGIKYRELFKNDHFKQLLTGMDNALDLNDDDNGENKNENYNETNGNGKNYHMMNGGVNDNGSHHSNSEHHSLELENEQEINQQLKEEMVELERENMQLKHSVQEMAQEAQSNKVLKQQNLELQQEIGELNKQIEDLNHDMQNMDLEMRNLHQQLAEAREIVENKDTEIERLSQVVTSKQTQITTYESNHTNELALNEQKLFDKHAIEMQMLEKQHEARLNGTKLAFQRQIAQLRAEKDYLAEQADQLAAENQYLKEQTFAQTIADELDGAARRVNMNGQPDLYDEMGSTEKNSSNVNANDMAMAPWNMNSTRARNDTRFIMGRQTSEVTDNSNNNTNNNKPGANKQLSVVSDDRANDVAATITIPARVGRGDDNDSDDSSDSSSSSMNGSVRVNGGHASGHASNNASNNASRQGTMSPPVRLVRTISDDPPQMSMSMGLLMKAKSDKYDRPESASSLVSRQLSADRVAAIKRNRHKRGDSYVLRSQQGRLGVSVGNSSNSRDRSKSPTWGPVGGGVGSGAIMDETNVKNIAEIVTKSITVEFNNSIDFLIAQWKSQQKMGNNGYDNGDEMDNERKDTESSDYEHKRLSTINESLEKGTSKGSNSSASYSVVSTIINDLNEMKTLLNDMKEKGGGRSNSNGNITLGNGDDMMDVFDQYFDESFKNSLKNDIRQTIQETLANHHRNGSNSEGGHPIGTTPGSTANPLFQEKSWWEWW